MLGLTGPQVTANRSGIYSVIFNSVVGPNTVVKQQEYYSYWAFGAPPRIVTQPHDMSATVGGEVTFNVAASGSNVLCYQWIFGGTTPLDGQTNSTLTLTNVGTTAMGSYAVVVTNFWGSVTSNPAMLMVTGGTTAPTIVMPPEPQSVLAGQRAHFMVMAQGTPPLGYQWQWNGRDLTNSSVVSGVNTEMLTLTGVQPANEGPYSVIVTNGGGSAASSAATLWFPRRPVSAWVPVSGTMYRLWRRPCLE